MQLGFFLPMIGTAADPQAVVQVARKAGRRDAHKQRNFCVGKRG